MKIPKKMRSGHWHCGWTDFSSQRSAKRLCKVNNQLITLLDPDDRLSVWRWRSRYWNRRSGVVWFSFLVKISGVPSLWLPDFSSSLEICKAIWCGLALISARCWRSIYKGLIRICSLWPNLLQPITTQPSFIIPKGFARIKALLPHNFGFVLI